MNTIPVHHLKLPAKLLEPVPPIKQRPEDNCQCSSASLQDPFEKLLCGQLKTLLLQLPVPFPPLILHLWCGNEGTQGQLPTPSMHPVLTYQRAQRNVCLLMCLTRQKPCLMCEICTGNSSPCFWFV